MTKYVVVTGDTLHELVDQVNASQGFFPCGGITVVTNQQDSSISFLQPLWSMGEEED
jgi:hypothetical protein